MDCKGLQEKAVVKQQKGDSESTFAKYHQPFYKYVNISINIKSLYIVFNFHSVALHLFNGQDASFLHTPEHPGLAKPLGQIRVQQDQVEDGLQAAVSVPRQAPFIGQFALNF